MYGHPPIELLAHEARTRVIIQKMIKYELTSSSWAITFKALEFVIFDETRGCLLKLLEGSNFGVFVADWVEISKGSKRSMIERLMVHSTCWLLPVGLLLSGTSSQITKSGWPRLADRELHSIDIAEKVPVRNYRFSAALRL